MKIEYDEETDQLSLIFKPQDPPEDTAAATSTEESQQKKQQQEASPKVTRVDLDGGDGYVEFLEYGEAPDFIGRICLNRPMTKGEVEAITYNDQNDVLHVLFSNQRHESEIVRRSLNHQSEFNLTIRKVHDRVFSLSLEYLGHCYDDVRKQLFGDGQWKEALTQGTFLVADERRCNKKLRSKRRDGIASGVDSYPQHQEPHYWDYCTRFCKDPIGSHECVLCEEFISVCEECEEAALSAWDGYVCHDCSAHEKKRCDEARAIIMNFSGGRRQGEPTDVV